MKTLMLIPCALALLSSAEPVAAQTEADYWTVDYLTPPDGEVIEVGGIDFLSDGRLIVSTRRGQVWIVENPLAKDPADAKFTLFAEGLWEGLGLNVQGEDIYVVQRTELSRLSDGDRDGVCDTVETICDDWGVSGNYHEFAFGLPIDKQGNFYISLNVSFFSPEWWHGKSPVPYRGWIMKISPTGEMTPVACGVRSPCGLGLNNEDDLFYTDNQGDWMPVCPIYHVKYGSFFGHPASLDWTKEYQASQTLASDKIPPARERQPAACWIPYDWSRSTGNLVMNNTSSNFGPFEGQMILGEVTNGLILRAQLEKVRGEYQGACMLVRQNVGSTCRVAFAQDGTLFAGLTNRGWGGLEPADGIARVRWTREMPMEMETVHLLQKGFEVKFTKPLHPDKLPAPADIEIFDYDYDYWWEYGSPERDHFDISVTKVSLSEDGMTLTILVDELAAGRVVRAKLTNVVSAYGVPLLHEEFAYTINRLPEGPLSTKQIAKLVTPPPARESEEAGWLRLTWGDALDLWESTGWELVSAKLDPKNPARFETSPGVGALCNTASTEPSDFVSKVHLGDVQLRFGFMLAKGADSGVLLQGRYEVQLVDLVEVVTGATNNCGALMPGADFAGSSAQRDGYSAAGVWHDLDITFRAPRFDADGKKIANARFEKVAIDDVVVQEDVEVSGPSASGWPGEAATGPIVFQGAGGSIAIGNVQVKALAPELEEHAEGRWTQLFQGDIEGWKVFGDDAWRVEDGVLIGSGERSHIFSPRGDYKDFDLRAELKLSDGGNSGLYFRVAQGDGWPAGYEAQINSNFADPQKSGSLYNFSPRLVQLVGPDTWFDYRISCTTLDVGTQVRIWINDVLVNDFVDIKNTHKVGHIALQQHHQGSVVELRRLDIRER